ncbi:RNA polymerase sigma factor [Nannocystis pusilla]|uniref:RNA polymerase sigma factor n=1 Tax=Nannocystis pusilla TaxID=889268 RepID=UPI003BF24643
MSKTLDTPLTSAEFAADVDCGAPSLREVFARHLGTVWRIARAFGVPADEADDVAQEVFLVVHRKLHTFQPSRSLPAWLFGITRNVVLMRRRAHTRRERRLSAVEPPPAPREPEASFELRQAAAFMQEFLDGLDEDKRLVFLLADIEGLTASEIAEALEIPLGTVFSRLRAARLKLEQFSQRLRARPVRRPHDR